MREEIRKSRVAVRPCEVQAELSLIPTLSKFEVESNNERYLQSKTRKILKLLCENLCDKIEIIGYGPDNIKGVETVCRMLKKWVTIVDVKCGEYFTGNRYIIVKALRSGMFSEGYQQAKEKVPEYRRKREYRKKVK